MTAARIERDVMTVVLPGDAEKTGEDHPWEWLVSLLKHAGVTETVDHLRGVPYEVRIAPDVISRLEPRDTRPWAPAYLPAREPPRPARAGDRHG